MNKFIKKLLLTLFLAIPSTFFQAFVFLKLYTWFFVTTFNFPTINIWQSLGILVTIGFLKYRVGTEIKEKTIMENIQEIVNADIVYLVSLLLGYLIFLMI